MSYLGVDWRVTDNELRNLQIKIEWNDEDVIFDSFILYHNDNSEDWIYKIETDQGDGSDIVIQNKSENEKFKNDSWLTSKKKIGGILENFQTQSMKFHNLDDIKIYIKFRYLTETTFMTLLQFLKIVVLMKVKLKVYHFFYRKQ